MNLILLILFTSCLKEDYFGTSSDALIKKIKISHQIGEAKINTEFKSIEVELSGLSLSEDVTIKILELSSFAKSNMQEGSQLDLTHTVYIVVTAEDGSQTIWSIDAVTAASHPQIRNHNFNDWFQTSSGYFEPAIGSDIFLLATTWSSNNANSNSIGIIPVVPFEIQNNNYSARIETMDNGLSSTKYGRISPGKIFTGKIDNLKHKKNQPGSGIDLGIEFTGHPKSFSIKYQYQPGVDNQDENGNSLGFSDAAEIYVFLEVRDSNRVRRLGTAWFRTEALSSSLSDVEINFSYGPLNASFPSYLSPTNKDYISADSAKFLNPTHFTFMANSSFMGDSLEGAVGSVLIIDNLKLNY